MKTLKNIYFLALVLGILMLSSCLKDEGYTDLYKSVNSQYVVSIFGNGYGEHFFAIDFSTQPIEVELFAVNVGSPQIPDKDINVKLSVNADLLRGTRYKMLPANAFTLPNSVIIPAGKRDASVKVKINPSLIDLTQSFALPLSIVEADNGAIIASNFKDAIYVININNIFSGIYKSTGIFNHPIAGVRDINEGKILKTIDIKTSETNFADLGGAGWLMWLVVNADNSVTLIPRGAANPSTTQFGENRYDPATKTFILNYKYPGGGGDRIINEMLKKQ